MRCWWLIVFALFVAGCVSISQSSGPSPLNGKTTVASPPSSAPLLELGDRSIPPSASVIDSGGGCSSPGVYEAEANAAEIVVRASWTTNCDATTDVEVVVRHLDGRPVEVSGTRQNTNNGATSLPPQPIDVMLHAFDIGGIVTGTWSDMDFWVVVDRPTLVAATTNEVVLGLGQVGVTPAAAACLIHNGGRGSDGEPLVRLVGRCDGLTAEVVSSRGDEIVVTTIED